MMIGLYKIPGLQTVQDARREIGIVKAKANEILGKMGKEWEKEVKKQGSWVSQNFSEVDRLQRLLDLKENRVMVELQKRQEKWKSLQLELETKLKEVVFLSVLTFNEFRLHLQ